MHEVPALLNGEDPHFLALQCQHSTPPRLWGTLTHCLQAVQRNGTLFMHVVFAKVGRTIDPDDPEYDEEHLFGRTERECTLAIRVSTIMPRVAESRQVLVWIVRVSCSARTSHFTILRMQLLCLQASQFMPS